MGHSEAETPPETGPEAQHDPESRAQHDTERKPGEPGPPGEPGTPGAAPVPPPEPPLAFTPDAGDFTEEHAQVFSALAAAQDANAGESVSVQQVALTVTLPLDRLRELLRDLTVTYRLADVTDAPGQGPRYTVKPRL